MKKIMGTILFSCAISCFATDNGYGEYSPIYVDANIGVNTANSDLGLNVNGGYLFNSFYGVEAGITGSNNYFMYDAAAKGILPLGSIINLYGKLGLGVNSYTGNNSSTNVGLLYGAGVGFDIAQNWELHVEDYTVTGNNPNFLMIGGQYRF
ncbi:MAG: hypothetical protein RL017_257 [Pseudomonadota bacterium]|nr:hypothetical protein [Burkholderiales bacterium]